VPGASAALLLDVTGEVVVESGTRDDRNRLVGAYQGIALGEAQRAAKRHGGGSVEELVCRYERGFVVLQPLKDGYYLVLVLGPGASLAFGRHRLRPARTRMIQEL
jgi:predicted regulator of Ras-like GTPase activity (Roadblock/LC7/MglB family)